MLSLTVATLPPPPPYSPPLTTTSSYPTYFPFTLQFQCQPHKPHHIYPSFTSGRTWSFPFAVKQQKDSTFGSLTLERPNFDDEDDVFDEEFDVEDDTEDDGDDDMVLPVEEMDDWLKNKPRGFGVGKVYDTSLEDKLVEEIEKSKKAQLDNVNKLKNESKLPNSKEVAKNVAQGVPGGVRVRVNNLPKKKNIHRDLKYAFEGVRGIINLSPVVSGNQKTREPVCRGFAFVDFKSLEFANEFVQAFSSQSITFGKMEKRIKCEILKPQKSSDKDSVQDGDGYNSVSASRFNVSDEESNQVDDFGNDPQLESSEDDDSDSDEDLDAEDITVSVKLLNAIEQGGRDSGKLVKQTRGSFTVKHEEKKTVKKIPKHADRTTTESLKQMHDPLSVKREENKVVKKKSEVKKKSDNKPKLKLPHSAKRLKVQEKAKLADALSRYGVREAMASKET